MTTGVPQQGVALTTAVEDGVAVVTFDLPGETVNKFTRAVRAEFSAALAALEQDAAVRAVVIISGKPDIFVAGADIDEFVALRTAEEATRLSLEGQALLDRLAAARKPVIAAVHGPCLGGGLEMILACHYRVASDDPATVFAAPEIQLGLLPGAGGCNRLPRAVGLRAALDLILTGRKLRAASALRMGLIDELVPRAILRQVAVAAAQRVAERPLTRRRAPRGPVAWILDRSAPGQALVLRRAREMTQRRTGGHYPAAAAALDAVRFSLANGMDAGLAYEAELFGRMAVTDVSRRLVEIFFATSALKKDPGVGPPAPAPRPVARLGILGAGFMGSGIAALAASHGGVPVRIKDADLARVGGGLKAASGIIMERVRRRSITRREGARLLALISGAADLSGFRKADLVIEAVFEELTVKQQVLREVETVAAPSCVFASNTSTIPIGRIAEASTHPETVVGMHFFSPVARMPLLEVIAAERTAPETVVTAVAFGRKLGKTVIVVRDRPGFFVNRILAPYLGEAGRLLAEGAPIESVDGAMAQWGFPVGPVTLLDEVGIDVAAKAGKVMHEAFGERLKPGIPLDALVADGRLGRKSGRGFFRYRNGKKGRPDEGAYRILGIAPGQPPGDAVIAERLSFAMLNEAVRALEDGVIRSPRDGDLGAIYGIGFPPFRGGPFRTLDAIGAGAAVATLERLAAAHGDGFLPAASLVEQARRGGQFHPSDR